MRYDKLHDEYLDWIKDKVAWDVDISNYTELFKYLFTKEFIYILDMDRDRFEDGIELRYQFAYEMEYRDDDISKSFKWDPCSVLEMMVALSLKCENHIMEDAEIGDRTGLWFWTMLDNLGISRFDDRHFSIYCVDEAVERFLNREYDPDGRGGLFTIQDCQYDLRNVDIWYQLNWYLNTII